MQPPLHPAPISSNIPTLHILLSFLTLALLSTPLTASVSTTVSPPPLHLSSIVDAIYVIGLEKCHQRWRTVHAWANAHAIPITPIYGTPYHSFNLYQPPIPIINMPKQHTVTAGQVACTLSHIRVWRHAFANNFSTIIVLEDDVTLTHRLLQNLPQLLRDAAQGSIRRNRLPWHYIYLRLHPIPSTVKQTTPHNWHGHVQIAPPAWGTAAYIASTQGIRFLLTRVTSYSYPLDVQIERFQHHKDTQAARFVALHACPIGPLGRPTPACPENIHELSNHQRGNCYFSASQSGPVRKASQMPASIPQTSR